MNVLKLHLKALDCKGVFLSASKTDAGTVAFYQKQNFKILKSIGGAYLMGCEL